MPSRDDGFAIADVDTGLFSDTKVKALARRVRDPHLTAEYLCLWVSTLLDSWGDAERVSFEDAVPAWFTEDVDSAIDHLRAVGMLDDGSRIPPGAWDNWFGPAWDRREKRRSSGRKGGLTSAEHRSSDAPASVEQRSSDAEPVPSVPSVPTEPTDPSDLQDDYYRMTGRFPSANVGSWLDRLSNEFGHDAASRKLAATYTDDREIRTLLSRTENALRADVHAAERRREAARAKREEERRAALQVTPEQAAENQRRFYEMQADILGFPGKKGAA